MTKLMQKHREEEGFTLIELLIVIIILGILAAVVIFGVSTLRDDSVQKACKTDKKQVETAVAAYVAKNNATPAEAQPGVDPGLVAAGLLRSYPGTVDYKIDYDKGAAGTAFTVTGETTASTDATPVAFAGC